MTPHTIPIQGTYNRLSNQLVLDFSNMPQPLNNNQNHSVSLSQQPNNQGSWVSPIPQQPTFIQKHGLRLGSSALGVAGSVGLLVSCIWSVLLPAIGSVGIIGIAYLVNRKITPLNAKGLSPVEVKSQSVFTQQIEIEREDSKSLLDEPIADINNLQQPIAPMLNNAAGSITSFTNKNNEPNIFSPPPPPPLPPPLEQKQEKSSINLGNTEDDLLSSLRKETELKPAADIKDTGQLPNPKDSRAGLLSGIRKGIDLRPVSAANTKQPFVPGDPRDNILSDIREGRKLKPTLNIEKINEIMEKSSPNLLLKVLQSAYEGALDISKDQDWKKYFQSKIQKLKAKDSLNKDKDLAIENPDIEDICKRVKNSRSLSDSMKWIQNLLRILSKHEDLAEKNKRYYSDKLEHINMHIKKLEAQLKGNILEVALLKGIEKMQFADSDNSDNDDVEDADSSFDD